MSKLFLKWFGGMRPRIGDQHLTARRLEETGIFRRAPRDPDLEVNSGVPATEAENCNLYSGELRPLRKPALAHEFCRPGEPCWREPLPDDPSNLPEPPPEPPQCVPVTLVGTGLTGPGLTYPVPAGTEATWTATIDPGATDPVQYQWYQGGIVLPGEVGPTLTLTLGLEDAYDSVRVFIQNPCASFLTEPDLIGEITFSVFCTYYQCDAYSNYILQNPPLIYLQMDEGELDPSGNWYNYGSTIVVEAPEVLPDPNLQGDPLIEACTGDKSFTRSTSGGGWAEITDLTDLQTIMGIDTRVYEYEYTFSGVYGQDDCGYFSWIKWTGSREATSYIAYVDGVGWRWELTGAFLHNFTPINGGQGQYICSVKITYDEFSPGLFQAFGQIRLWQDGVKVYENLNIVGTQTLPGWQGIEGDNLLEFLVAQGMDGRASHYWWREGGIDDAEVAELYDAYRQNFADYEDPNPDCVPVNNPVVVDSILNFAAMPDGTTITDTGASGFTWTANGAAAISGGRLVLPGTSDANYIECDPPLQVAGDYRTVDWTIEGKIKINDVTGNPDKQWFFWVPQDGGGDKNAGILIYQRASTNPATMWTLVSTTTEGDWIANAGGTDTFAVNDEIEFAVSRVGGEFLLHIDGVYQTKTGQPDNFAIGIYPPAFIRLGGKPTATVEYFSEMMRFRMTSHQARYGEVDYTPEPGDSYT